MLKSTTVLLAMMCSLSAAPAVRSGKAEAAWLSSSSTYQSGVPVQTAVKLVVDEHWHTYWTNPGDAGMAMGVEWQLPAGWTAGELEHPLPIRFQTGELLGFGYEGTVVLPVRFTPPAGFTGKAELKGKLSWLTCNDDGCVPGNADIQLMLDPGPRVETPDATTVTEATLAIPKPADATMTLNLVEAKSSVRLSIQPANGGKIDLSGYEALPTAADILAPSARIRFTQQDGVWQAEVPKNQYLKKPVTALTLVLFSESGGTKPPISLKWKQD